MKKFFNEFKTFAVKGNFIDLAIGVVIGSTFGAITSTFIEKIVMPFLGLFIGGIDISAWVINIPNFIYGGEPIVLGIGAFLMAIINFIVIAFVLFLVVKGMNALKKKEEAAPPPPPAEPEPTKEELLLAEIRDILKEKK